MGIDIVVNESSLAIELETTEGTYVPEQSGASFVEVESGATFTLSRDQLDREILTDTVEKVKSRTGAKNVSHSFVTELKAGDTEGELPVPYDVLWRSLLGGKRARNVTVTSGTGHTTTQINIGDADISEFQKHDVVVIQEAGAYHSCVVTAVDSTLGAAHIDIFPAAPSAPADASPISKSVMYYHDSDDLETFSATYYYGGKVRDKVDGLRNASASIDNWTSGQLPKITWSGEGLDLDKEVGTPLFSPTFPQALPPILLNACAFLKFEDGSELELQYTDFALTIENELSKKSSACSESGFIGTSVTGLTVSGSINPYMEDDDTERFDALNLNKDFQLFVRAYNPTAVDGEFGEMVSFWIPNATITEVPAEDLDGNYVDNMSFTTHRVDGGDSLIVGFV